MTTKVFPSARYSANEISRYIVSYEWEHKRIVNNLRVQRLLYFIQMNFLGEKQTPCFREDIEAWSCGPIVHSIYQKYTYYGMALIPPAEGRLSPRILDEDKALINEVLEMGSNYSSSNLLDLICTGPTAWRKTYQEGQRNIISLQALYEDYTNNQ